MAELETRIKALEVGASFDATQAEVQQVESEFLTKLQDIREAMVNVQSNGSGGGSSKEMTSLQAENEALKKRNAKLDYRVRHMLKTMNDLYDNKQSKASSTADA